MTAECAGASPAAQRATVLLPVNRIARPDPRKTRPQDVLGTPVGAGHVAAVGLAAGPDPVQPMQDDFVGCSQRDKQSRH